MIKKTLMFCLVGLFSLFVTTVALATPGWEISIHQWDSKGSFDYTLYHPYSSQVVSKVSLPQDQAMKILDVKYNFIDEKNYIKLQYGETETGIKGRGSDSDWMIEGSNTLTDYGELDASGKQTVYAIDFGRMILKNQAHQMNIYLGWIHQETTNELKNIVYFLSKGEDLGELPQPDNGSSLDGKFYGLTLGIDNERIIGANLKLTTGLSLSFLKINAYGHWGNHIPAWNWENTGRTVGYRANIGLKYAFSENIQAELGYYYNYAKSTGCKEILNGDLLTQLVDLEYEQKGLHLGLILLF